MSADLSTHRTLRPCPVCSGHQAAVLHTRRFVLPEGHPLDAPYAVVCCEACGMAFADTPLEQDAYDAYYEQGAKYADQQTGTGGGSAAWDDERLRTTAATVAEHLPSRAWRIVDVGCAGGGLLRWLAHEGHRSLDGVDPSPACARTVADIPGVRGHVGSLLALPRDVLRADAAVLSHVLEHVRDVDGAMEALRALVRVGGRLYVEVPDATRYDRFLVAPFQDFNVEHINHFSAQSLGTLLARHGFRVVAHGQKAVPASADVLYPAAWVVAECTDTVPGSDWVPERDQTLLPAMQRYVAASRERLAAIDDRLLQLLHDVPELIVWGTGQTARELLAETALGRAHVVAFADSNPLYRGHQLGGAPVVAPEDLQGYAQPILVGSIVSQAAIVDRATELGLRDRLLLLDPASPPPV